MEKFEGELTSRNISLAQYIKMMDHDTAQALLAELIERNNDELDGMSWLNESPQGLRPSSKFLETLIMREALAAILMGENG